MVLTNIKIITPFLRKMGTRAYNATISVLLWFAVLLLAQFCLEKLGLDWTFAQNVYSFFKGYPLQERTSKSDSTKQKTVKFLDKQETKEKEVTESKPKKLSSQVDSLKKKTLGTVKRYMYRGYEIAKEDMATMAPKELKKVKVL